MLLTQSLEPLVRKALLKSFIDSLFFFLMTSSRAKIVSSSYPCCLFSFFGFFSLYIEILAFLITLYIEICSVWFNTIYHYKILLPALQTKFMLFLRAMPEETLLKISLWFSFFPFYFFNIIWAICTSINA